MTQYREVASTQTGHEPKIVLDCSVFVCDNVHVSHAMKTDISTHHVCIECIALEHHKGRSCMFYVI